MQFQTASDAADAAVRDPLRAAAARTDRRAEPAEAAAHTANHKMLRALSPRRKFSFDSALAPVQGEEAQGFAGRCCVCRYGG